MRDSAKLEIWAKLFRFLIGEHLPRSLDNLKNFSNFTAIRLYRKDMEFSGPNGQVKITLRTSRDYPTELTLGSLAELDTSKTERLEIEEGYLRSKVLKPDVSALVGPVPAVNYSGVTRY